MSEPRKWSETTLNAQSTPEELAEWEAKVQDVEAGLLEPAFIDNPADPTGPKILNPLRGQLTEKGRRKLGVRSVK